MTLTATFFKIDLFHTLILVSLPAADGEYASAAGGWISRSFPDDPGGLRGVVFLPERENPAGGIAGAVHLRSQRNHRFYVGGVWNYAAAETAQRWNHFIAVFNIYADIPAGIFNAESERRK